MLVGVDEQQVDIGEHVAHLGGRHSADMELLGAQAFLHFRQQLGVDDAGWRQLGQALVVGHLVEVLAGSDHRGEGGGGGDATQRIAAVRHVDALHDRDELFHGVADVAEVADVELGAVQGEGMEAVTGGLFAGGFPVGGDGQPLGGAEHFHAAVGLAEHDVVVKLHIPQLFLEGACLLVPGGEDNAVKKLNPGFLQAEFFLGIDIPVHFFLFEGGADKTPVGTEGPAVIDALVNLGVAGLGGAHMHAAVGADVQAHMNLALAIPGDDHFVLAHVTHHIVSGVGDLGCVAKQQPDLGEDLVHFDPVEIGVVHGAQGHFAGFQIEQIGDGCAVRQDRVYFS